MTTHQELPIPKLLVCLIVSTPLEVHVITHTDSLAKWMLLELKTFGSSADSTPSAACWKRTVRFYLATRLAESTPRCWMNSRRWRPVYLEAGLDPVAANPAAICNPQLSQVFHFNVLAVYGIDRHHGNVAQGRGRITLRVNYPVFIAVELSARPPQTSWTTAFIYRILYSLTFCKLIVN